MDKAINKLKLRYVQETEGLPSVAAPNYDKAIQELQNFGVVADFMAFPEIIALFRRTHERLYQVFGSIDHDLAGCNQAGASATWAATYSEFMTKSVTDPIQSTHIPKS